MAALAHPLSPRDQLYSAPDHLVAELLGGELSLQPRPSTRHAQAATTLGEELGPPFKRGRGGPGGWIILDEPELHLGADILVPDLAGWRRERMPHLPDAAHITVAPDWACEVISPGTARLDRTKKLPIYAREQVQHVWLVDPIARTLEVFERQGELWLLLQIFAQDAPVRARPFDAIELDLSLLWADLPPIE